MDGRGRNGQRGGRLVGGGNVSGMGKTGGEGVEEAVSSSSPGPHVAANGGGRWRLCSCMLVERLESWRRAIQRPTYLSLWLSQLSLRSINHHHASNSRYLPRYGDMKLNAIALYAMSVHPTSSLHWSSSGASAVELTCKLGPSQALVLRTYPR